MYKESQSGWSAKSIIVAFAICIFIAAVIIIVYVAKKQIGDDNMNAKYNSISMDEAKKIFESAGDYIIVDVRHPEEYAEGHIPNAINIPNEDIDKDEPSELPDKKQTIYVYCRSGNRSKQASKKLSDMGYKNIIEFGGIIDWTGTIEQ